MGGHVVRSPRGASGAGASTPVACRTQAPSSGRAEMVNERRPDASGSATATWSCTEPCAGSTSGACTVSSSSSAQSTWSAARMARSTNAVPGTNTRPDTTWSASHGWVPTETRPVNTTPPSSDSSTTAPSSGWSAAPRPAEVTSTAAVSLPMSQ